jgi:hypothetical protein
MPVLPFDAYRLYMAVKLHMTSDAYDIGKYGDHPRSLTPAAFERRPDKWSFVKLSKMFQSQDHLVLFLACNHLYDSPYIRDLINVSEHKDHFQAHLKVRESLVYTIEKDLRYLLDRYTTPMDMLTVTSGGWPALATEVQHKQIDIETVCVLGNIMQFLPMWKTRVTDTIIWPTFYRQLIKFAFFVPYDAAMISARVAALVAQHQQENS